MATKSRSRNVGRRPRTSLDLFLDLCLGIYAVAIAVIWLTNLIGPDLWWFSAANLYLPQWIYALPAIPLFVLALAARSRRWFAPVVLAACVLGPLMGLRFRWFSDSPVGAQAHLRIMTWNVKWFGAKRSELVAEIRRVRPDIVVMQDAPGAGRALASQLGPEWQVVELAEYVLASRRPISAPEPRWISYPEHNHRAARVEMDLDGRKVIVYTVHFMSPRTSLLRVRSLDSRAAESLEGTAAARIRQAEMLAYSLSHEKDPVVLGGDLNAPMQSLVVRTLLRAGMHDAFDEAGRGYGYTYGHNVRRIGASFVRIDHILASRQWTALDCRVGDSRASDHQPVIADLVLTAP